MKNTRINKLPVGIENFEKIRTGGFYYVDKTALIRDLLNTWGEVNLFTRPRRFGKSLNMSMLKTFFEIGTDKSLFDGLEIAGETELCDEYMGRFPVISVSLKGIDAADYRTARSLAVKAINEEARRLSYLMESDRLSRNDKAVFSLLMERDMDDDTLICSLRELSELLWKHHGQKVIILIDEYDVPLAKAKDEDYYDKMVNLMRDLFNQALKTNDSLYFAVLTGCLRVSKESIFTGLNNPKIFSITTVRLDEYFGFTDAEVRRMLQYYHLEDKYDEIKDWYDGYRFGNADVYCPWDVINYCDELLWDSTARPVDYWSNTSGNDVIRHFIEQEGDGLTKAELESLVAGETVTKKIREELTYRNLYDSIDNIWSLLFMTGYLTQRGQTGWKTWQLTIPNREIRNIFTDQIMEMFKANVAKDGERLAAFCSVLQNGDVGEVERQFTAYLEDTISIRDTFVRKPTKENFYHGILIGILGFKGDWYVKSNKESGDGYSDIIIRIEKEKIGIVIEVKYADDRKYELACKEAMDQIEREKYAQGLKKEGYHSVCKYGVACFKRECKVVMEKEGTYSERQAN
ncbi:MAG: ATP-binding protein [Lachnospiraceae bacterium]|nr:ATP-binding protein [Lachnospiraceae bacterium]